MSVTAPQSSITSINSGDSRSRLGDRLYFCLLWLSAALLFALILGVAGTLFLRSQESIKTLGTSFITNAVWDDAGQKYGILPFLFGTLYSSLIALIIAVPVSIGAAVFLSEMAPKWLRTPVTFLIELLAAIPSVVYGLWGIFLLIPFLRDHVMQPLINPETGESKLAKIPVLGALLSGSAYGPSMLTAGVILAIMITPFITAVSRDLLRAIPKVQREASYGLGGTKWETIQRVVIPYAKSGIIGAIVLGLGRALGETMAVTMVIGNQAAQTPSGTTLSLFDPGYTMASALANKFNEAQPGLNTSALIEIGLTLFLVSVCVNSVARLLVRYTAKSLQK